jgi:hypothetical protein
MVKSGMHVPMHRRGGRVVALIVLQALLALALITSTSIARAENQVLRLDGKGSYVELPPNIFKDLTQATVEAWVKWDRFNSFSRVFEFGAPWQSLSLFNQQTNSDLRLNLYPVNSKSNTTMMYVARATNVLRTNEWFHVAAVTGTRNMKLYLNGQLVASNRTTKSFASIDAFHTNLIGRGMSGNPTDQDFRGQIDEFRVWNHRRSAVQIRENMNVQMTGKEKGLVGLWNFENGNATDATKAGHHGKMIGRARVVPARVGFPADLAAAAAEAAAAKAVAAATTQTQAPATNVVIVTTVPTAATPASAQAGSNIVAWCIAGALCVLAALCGCLVLMLRRSGVGKPELLTGKANLQLGNAGKTEPTGNTAEIKERALAELTEFAKESLVQGLYSQRAALLDAQKKAQQELADLEVRLASLQLPERIRAYEQRIAELEAELETRGEELREVTQATLLVFRRKLAEEKQSEATAHRN